MKNVLLALVAISLLVFAGCAAPVDDHADDDHADDAAESAPADDGASEEAEEVAPTPTGDVTLGSAGFDPDTLAVSVGTTVTITVTEGKHQISVNGKKISDNVEANAQVDHTFDTAGTQRVFDVFSKKSLVVTVS